MGLLITVIVVALIFEYINGFHDTANSIETVVSTKVLTPRQAVVLAACTNLLGAMWGTGVAKTISSGLVDSKMVAMTSGVIICAVIGAIFWNLLTWFFGLPSSSSHALIGGLVGSALVSGALVHWSTIVDKVVLPMVLSPAVGFVLAFLVMLSFLWIFRRSNQHRVG